MLNTKLRKYLFSNFTLALTSFILLLLAGSLNINLKKPILNLSKQDTALNINKDLLVLMGAGNKRLITDLLWIQTLIESDLEHYKNRDLNNWLFLRFNTISILDPKFYENYLFGGQFLAIIKDDLDGASEIYEKGLKHFPEDYKLNFNAGFLNYYERGDYARGLKFLSRIENNPLAPIFIKSIINKLKLESGTDIKSIFSLVFHNYETTKDIDLKNKLRSDLYAIKAEVDLDCLNNKKNNCEMRDLDGSPYVYQEGKFLAKKKFRPYRITTRKILNN